MVAKVVIEAMKEPTRQMKMDGMSNNGSPSDAYRLMIEAALKDD